MKKDLEQFKRIAEKILDEEVRHPVAQHIDTGRLFDVLDLDLNDEGLHELELEKVLTELVLNTPHTGSKAFFNQLFGGRKGKAVLGELLAVMLNTSMYTYKVGGAQIGIEKKIIRKICDLAGYDERSDGTFAPGGSMSNLMSVIMARDNFNPDIKSEGVSCTMTMYTSKESHYSVWKNAAFCGIGRHQVRSVDTNNQAEMLPQHLEQLIKEDLEAGKTPFMINATAATTVMAAFDPVEPIADIAEKYGLWLHVDGAYGASVLFSDKYKHLVKGIQRADSFSLNAHKMLGTPLQCSMIFARDKGHLLGSFSNDASYLYQTDSDEFNPGKTSLLCGRRNDALKFWTLWKSIGTKGLAAIVDRQFELAEYAHRYVTGYHDYQVYSPPGTMSVCFNYKGIPAPELCNALYRESALMVGYGEFDGDVFIRLVFVNSDNTAEEIDQFFTILEGFVAKHEDKLTIAANSAKS